MTITLTPGPLHGILQAPASKSAMQRACAAALLHKGETIIYNPGHSHDDRAALSIISALGARVETDSTQVRIESRGVVPVSPRIDCGESGLSMRMFTPIAALADVPVSVHGQGSLVRRPQHFFDEVLPRLGVQTKSEAGFLPLQVKGPLQPTNITVDGSLSSQFLTGLLLAFSARGAAGITLEVQNLKSKPYIDLTLALMRHFGMKVPVNEQYERFIFGPEEIPPAPPVISYTVESDWSGGAFLLVAGAIAGPLLVTGLDPSSTQADRAILDALMAAQAGVAIEAKGIRIHPGQLHAFSFDATDCPDLFPPLVALAAYARGTTRIRGVHRLAHKESHRANTLQESFGRMGVPVSFESDEMLVQGGGVLRGAAVHSHDDHRIAMALSVAALGATGSTVLRGAEAVRKSYPDFFQDLRKAGARLEGFV